MNREIEVRFIDIDKPSVVEILRKIRAVEEPEITLEEIIFYDPELKWRDVERRLVKLRRKGKEIILTYKHRHGSQIDGTEEVELINIHDFDKAKTFIERIGLIPFRHQEKLRHSFQFDDVRIDIDTWPTVPPYMEIEGSSEESLRNAAERIGFSWKNIVTEDPLVLLEKYYGIPFGKLRKFTFSEII